jgi:hypothetical protein
VEDLEKVSLEIKGKLNHQIYCHHCRGMGQMAVLGIDFDGRVHFKCTRQTYSPGGYQLGPCEGVVVIQPITPTGGA